MSSSLNRVCLIGRLGKNPEVRSMQGGDQFVTLSLATSETWTKKNTGERQAKTEWHNVVIFNEHLVRTATEYLFKGSRVYIEGSLQSRTWQDQRGEERRITEVVLRRHDAKLIMLDAADRDHVADNLPSEESL